MTTQEAAASLDIDRGTVLVQIRNGRLRAKKIGRDWNIAPSEVERYRANVKGKPGRRPASPAR